MTQTEALLFSVVVEAPTVALVAWASGDRRAPRWLVVGVLATCVTHPLVWHGVPALRPWMAPWWPRAILFELGAVLAEGGIFAWTMAWPVGRALQLSLVANTLSFGLGLAWFWLS